MASVNESGFTILTQICTVGYLDISPLYISWFPCNMKTMENPQLTQNSRLKNIQ